MYTNQSTTKDNDIKQQFLIVEELETITQFRHIVDSFVVDQLIDCLMVSVLIKSSHFRLVLQCSLKLSYLSLVAGDTERNTKGPKPLVVIGGTVISLSVSYMSAVVDMRQIIGRTRQQLDKDSCRIAWGANIAIEILGRGKNLAASWFKEHQPLPVRLLLLLAVFTQNHTSRWWQADRNVTTQYPLHLETPSTSLPSNALQGQLTSPSLLAESSATVLSAAICKWGKKAKCGK